MSCKEQRAGVRELTKVLHIIPKLGIGGAEVQLFLLIANSSRSNFSHEVVCYEDATDKSAVDLYQQASINVTQVARSRTNPLRFLQLLTRSVKASAPDIVHCWLISANFWGRLAAILAGRRKIVASWRSAVVWNERGMRWLERFTSNRVVHVANSWACAQSVAAAIRVPKERFTIVYNGIWRRLPSENTASSVESVLSSIPDGFRIVTMVGRLTELKNYPMLLRIAKRCTDDSLPVHFLIIGHGEEAVALRDMAERLGVSTTVTFLGLRDDIPDLLSISDVYIHTSHSEGFPNAVLEAMSAELPVLCTDFPGAEELVTDSVNGLIVPRNDDYAAYMGLTELLSSLALWREAAAKTAHEVRDRFSVSRMVDNTLELYGRMLNER